MTFLKVKRIGDELVVALDEGTRALLGAKDGDTLVVTEGQDGKVELSMPDHQLLKRLERGRAFFAKYRSTFEALAK